MDYLYDRAHCYVMDRLAMQEIGKVTGRVDVEEILDVLFRDFCIGK